MPNCIRCGRSVEGLSADELCDSCAATSGIGTPTDVPCQRCGMYLPPHELRMWNSRLYCAYCIMDIQDDEHRAKGEKKPEEKAAREEGGGLFSGLFGGKAGGEKDSGSAEKKADAERYQQYARAAPGTCERCGRESYVLYLVQGRKLCTQCIDEGAASGAPPSFFAQIVSSAKRAVGIRQASKIIENTPAGKVFDIRSRKMVEQKEGKDEGEQPPSPSAEVFNVSERSG